ncbi:MAG: hypothetical protein ACRYGF_08675 [Janthinobacterium lividum]
MEQPPSRWLPNIRYGLVTILGISLLVAAIGTRAWPLAGDAALMHYVVFLLRGGAAPYRQVIDINLPGSYLFEASGMALFGTGALGLRLYDWLLMACVAAGALGCTGRKRWFAATFAGLFFALVHLQDGVAQQGQRDLLLAALLLCGLGALRLILQGTRHSLMASLAFGLAFGVSFTIKPVLLPLAVALLIIGLARSNILHSAAPLAVAIFGLLSPSLVAIGWLFHQGVWSSFLWTLRSLLPLHAALGRRPIGFLLVHSFSPVGVLLLLTILVMVLGRGRFLDGKLVLATAFVGTLIAYGLQGKAYPYQRYPFVAVLLVAIGLVLDRSLDTPGKARVLAYVMVCWAACLGVYFAWRSVRFDPQTPFVAALSTQLQIFGTAESLAGQVQCLDTFGGCVNTLYDLQIRQSTGFLYDCYLFTDASRTRDEYRERFWAAFQSAKPRLVVLSSQNCFKDFSTGYDRVSTWPAFDGELHQQYHEVGRWTPSGPVSWFSQKGMPFGFRLFLRNGS